MMFQFIEFAQLKTTPWKNGRGVTREIAAFPESCATFDWRLSIAQVAQSGPFSQFPAVDRWLMLLRGQGMRLLASDWDYTLRQAYDIVHFDGEESVSAELLQDETTDFNLMIRRDRFSATLTKISASERTDFSSSADVLVVFALSRSAHGLLNAQTVHFAQFDTVILQKNHEQAIEVALNLGDVLMIELKKREVQYEPE